MSVDFTILCDEMKGRPEQSTTEKIGEKSTKENQHTHLSFEVAKEIECAPSPP